jgi:hypothetical protein
MMVNRALLAATALLFAATAVPALAHDDNVDHAGQWRLHQASSEATQRAHEEGSYREAEHRADHRALRDPHEDSHVDPAGNWHVHYGWGFRYLGPRFWGIGYY